MPENNNLENENQMDPNSGINPLDTTNKQINSYKAGANNSDDASNEANKAAIRAAGAVAGKVGGAYGKAIAAGVKIADKVGLTDVAANGMTRINEAAGKFGVGKVMQGALNKAHQSGATEAIEKTASMGTPGAEVAKNSTNLGNATPKISGLDGLSSIGGGNSNSSGSGDILGGLAKSYFQKHKLMIIASCSGIAFFVLILFVILGGGVEASNEGNALLSTYISCDTITIVNPDTNVETTLDFEQYVAGVVTAESLRIDSPESAKAQAIIARTYAIKNTNFCTTTIENSQNKQVYKEPIQAGIDAAEATKGIIMVDSLEPSNLLSTYFASYSDGVRDWPAFPACTPVNCTDSSCTTTFYKVGPNNTYEANEFTMNRRENDGSYWNGLDLTNQTGHCYGLSQVGAWYLETIGYNYKDILDEFYFDYSLSSILSGSGLTSMLANIDWYEIRTNRTGITSLKYWTSSNRFYTSRTELMGQCTWYTHGRAKEILELAYERNLLTLEEYNSTINVLDQLLGNAHTWWTENKALGSNGLSFSSDVPKVGSIVVFGGSSDKACGTYYNAGHVGVVENVYYDEYGNWTSVWISDGWKDSNCEKTACFRSQEWTREEVENYRNGCRPLLGFIYLINYEEL